MTLPVSAHQGRNPLFSPISRSTIRRLLLPAGLALLASGHGMSGAAAQTADTVTRLPEISVTANRTDTPLDEVGSAVTVITREQLENRQTAMISDVLREVPGLAVNRTGAVGNLTQIRIRGAEANHTLVLIDGIEVNDPSSSSEFDFAHLLAADIERIEVLRGPQSALYGSDAVGGVINIVTRRGSGKPEARASLEAGSHNTYQGNASVAGGGERYDFMLGGVRLQTGGISTADGRRGNPENDGYRNATLYTRLGARPAQNLDLGFAGRFTDYHMEGDDFTGGTGAVDGSSDADGQQLYGRGQGKLTLLDGHWEHILGLGYTHVATDYLTNDRITSRYRGVRRKYDYQTNILFDTPAVADASHTVTLLAEREDENVRSRSSYSNIDRDIESDGYVALYKLDLFERLFLTGAAREDRHDLFADATTYRLTAAWDLPDSGTKLRTSWGTGVKNPSMFELYGYTQTYQGNPNLKPEEGHGWDAGLDQTLWNGLATASLTYFDERIDNLIQGTGTSSVNVNGTSHSNGIETALTLRPVEDLILQGSYTFMRTRSPADEQLVRRPSQLASLNADYRFLDGKANVNLGIVFNGRQADNAYTPSYSTYRVALASYTLVNLAGGYRLTDSLELTARIENLLDTHYEEVYTYGTPGRTAYAGLRMSF
jgi:vitamin B12 transporter